jgi:hypothetical protein
VLVVGGAAGTLAGGDALQNVFVRKYDSDGTELWTRVFRAGTSDVGYGVAVDGGGNVFVGGGTYFGVFPGQTGANYTDAFVRKYDASGAELWTVQFGTNGSEYVRRAAVDSNGGVIVTGLWSGTIPDIFTGQESVLVRKFDASGAAAWSRDFGTTAFDDGYGVSIAGSGNVYVGGKTHGTLPGQSGTGGAFLRKYNTAGTEQWTRQFGTNRSDEVRSVGVDENENVYAAGTTASQPFLRKYDASGTEQWTRQFGTSGSEWGVGVAVHGDGNAHVVGNTNGTLPGQSNLGDYDCFVRKYDASGVEQWTRQLGTNVQDVCESAAGDGSSVIYVVGATRGAFPGFTNAGLSDAFLLRIVR